MSWLDKLNPKKILWSGDDEKSSNTVPEGLWLKCDSCQSTLYRAEVEKQQYVCPKCDFHMRMRARKRLELFLDDDSFIELDPNLTAIDSLKFKDSKKYTDRINTANKSTGEKEALVSFHGKLMAMSVVATAFEFRYMGGSMGSVVGEKFIRSAERALETQSPLICFSASGGARMQESMHSLMQMAKTSAAIKKLNEHKIPFISVLTDPTMGGVSASLAMLGDLIIAEPNALVGFAGQRVIEQTVGEKLPEDFQQSEFLLQHGAIDLIINRNHMRPKIHQLLTLLMNRTF